MISFLSFEFFITSCYYVLSFSLSLSLSLPETQLFYDSVKLTRLFAYIYFHRDYVHQSNIIIDHKKVNTIQNRRTSVIKFNNDSTLYKTWWWSKFFAQIMQSHQLSLESEFSFNKSKTRWTVIFPRPYQLLHERFVALECARDA